jgi:L-ascorbate metabolism protein UlaG (beta-lactamase superfamily)
MPNIIKHLNHSLPALCFLTFFLTLHTPITRAHDGPEATYLGNEGIMIQSGKSKILFDPFFHNIFGVYQKVPTNIRKAILTGAKPYDDIDAIFISHTHEDHFSVTDVRHFLTAQPKAKLIAPTQAVNELIQQPGITSILSRVVAVSLEYGDKPWQYKMDGLVIDAVRITHAGWPGRANVENIVFRVTLNEDVTVMHMGDADPNDEHFKPFRTKINGQRLYVKAR